LHHPPHLRAQCHNDIAPVNGEMADELHFVCRRRSAAQRPATRAA
jgi:hypothetical protein